MLHNIICIFRTIHAWYIPYACVYMHTIQPNACGMAVYTIWANGDMKAAEAQRYYRHLERSFSLAAAIIIGLRCLKWEHGTTPIAILTVITV